MADFRAKVTAELDISKASGQLNNFLSQIKSASPVNIDVNLNLNKSSQALNSLLQQLRQVGAIGSNNINVVNAASITLNNSFNNVRNNLSNVSRQMRQFNELQAKTFGNQMTTWANNNGKALKSVMADGMQTYGQAINSLQSRLNTAILKQDASAVAQLRDEFRLLQSEARATGNVGKTFGQQFTSALGGVAKFAASYVSLYRVFNEIRQGVQTVVELDDALVDLQKTSTASTSQLNSFYKEANGIAKQYGATTKEIIQGAADWSRLGFSLEDSKTMSKLSSQFASISPGVSVEQATSGLVSAMKAFDISADEALDSVMSKINIVGNSFAVSNGDIIEGLQRSSAAMSAMGQDLDSTIALFTAANEVLQDSSTTGTALRSMALRIRGFDEETEQLSEDLVGVTGKIADLTKTASNPQGISIFTDASQTHYKDFVDYFRELSNIWDELSEKNRQGLLNELFGKRGAQAGAAIIKNFDAVEESLKKMSNSAGNADAEMEIITNSLSYKLNALKETGTGIFQNLFQREDMGVLIDGFTSVLEVIDAITEKIGLFGTVTAGLGIAAIIKDFGNNIALYGCESIVA